MKILSLFDGISGARQAPKELGINCEYFSSEINKYAIQVSKVNHPDITQIGDVKGLCVEDGYLFYNQNNDPMKNGGSVKADFDLLIIHYSEDRELLLPELFRILREIKPRYILLERMDLLSEKHRNLVEHKILHDYYLSNIGIAAGSRKRLWLGHHKKIPYEKTNFLDTKIINHTINIMRINSEPLY